MNLLSKLYQGQVLSTTLSSHTQN